MFDWKNYSGFGGTIQVCKKTRLVQVTDIIATMCVMREKGLFPNRAEKKFPPYQKRYFLNDFKVGVDFI